MEKPVPSRWLGELDRFRSEIDELFERFFDWRPSFHFMEKSRWSPSIDVSEKHDEIIVRVEIPGMEKEDIDISLDGRFLTISGERKVVQEEENEHYHRVERRYGAFSRSLELPVDVDTKDVKAVYKRGVLKLNLPKLRRDTRKRIEIMHE